MILKNTQYRTNEEFQKSLRDKSFGYVSEIIENSKKMLKATVKGDTKTIESIFHDVHNSEIPILKYNYENSLSYVVTLEYLSARDTYRVEREEKLKKSTNYIWQQDNAIVLLY